MKLKKLLNKLTLSSICLTLLSGCLSGLVGSEGRGNLPVIEDFSITQEDESTDDCQDGSGRSFGDVFINIERSQCFDECAEGFRVATEEEVNLLLEEIKTEEGLSEEDFNSAQETIAATKGVCIEEIFRQQMPFNLKIRCVGA